MHEFSLASNILEIVEENIAKYNASKVTELTLDIGSLAGVEIQALITAIESIQPGTVLDKAHVKLNVIHACAICLHCKYEFEPEETFSPCPQCTNFGIEIISGKELVVKSIVAE